MEDTVNIELSDHELATIALAAHHKDMTLNDFIVEIITNHIATMENQDESH